MGMVTVHMVTVQEDERALANIFSTLGDSALRN